tara:strand:- start:15329 stop:16513 length:1185 start_codon:yes stop_codon:yes gene_type:complete
MNRVDKLERQFVEDVLDSNFSSSSGSKYMSLLENEFSKKFGKKFAVSFINGTATMHACLEAWGIGEGDEVIVTPLTMASTTFCVLQANATPIFADINEDTFCIDPDKISEKITERTKAIIPVSIFGLSPDMESIMNLAKPRNIKVLEDNAETFLGFYKNKIVGHFGDAASYSFQSTKHLTSGEGGIVITDDEQFALNLRRVCSLGYAGISSKKGKISKDEIQDPSYERHVALGWNYRMPELCCAVAYAQTLRIDELVKIRKETGNMFNDAISEYEDYLVPQFVGEDYENSFWAWTAKINEKDAWHEFRKVFLNNGGDKFYGAWKLTYQEPFIKDRKFLRREKYLTENANYFDGACPVAEDIQKRLMCFKTNYWDLSKAREQAIILKKTCKDLFK